MAIERRRIGCILCVALTALISAATTGCARPASGRIVDAVPVVTTTQSATRPASQPSLDLAFDTTIPKPVIPRDRLEREALNREGGLRLVDRLVDRRTALPPFVFSPPPALPKGGRITTNVAFLDNRDPFPEPPRLQPKEESIEVGIARSTFRTRELAEVLSALQPFIDIVQRDVDVRVATRLYETADDLFFNMSEGKDNLAVSNVFEYLLIRDWISEKPDNGAVLLATARPAHPRTGQLDHDFPGTPGTSIELVVSSDSAFKSFADLKGARLALTANIVPGPGTFLTHLLADAGQPRDQPFFSKVTLRRYAKDTVIDVLKGAADAACVDQGTVGAVARFYGVDSQLRVLAVSPRYNVDVLFTSLNNIAAHPTEIELTQRQLTTLGKDPEGQEVLFFFDVAGWTNYRDDDIAVPRANYVDYVKFIQETPVDLKPLLDPRAPVDRRTYDRFGDE